jgi:hypothetical protein
MHRSTYSNAKILLVIFPELILLEMMFCGILQSCWTEKMINRLLGTTLNHVALRSDLKSTVSKA